LAARSMTPVWGDADVKPDHDILRLPGGLLLAAQWRGLGSHDRAGELDPALRQFTTPTPDRGRLKIKHFGCIQWPAGIIRVGHIGIWGVRERTARGNFTRSPFGGPPRTRQRPGSSAI